MGWCKAFPPSFLETLSLLGHLAAPEGTPLLDLMLLASRAWGAGSYLLHGQKHLTGTAAHEVPPCSASVSLFASVSGVDQGFCGRLSS